MQLKLDKTYEVKTTLGTIFELEEVFDKTFFEVLDTVTGMKSKQQAQLLYIGFKEANPGISEEVFFTLCKSHLGLTGLILAVEKYLAELQFSGLTEQEVQKLLEKKSEPGAVKGKTK